MHQAHLGTRWNQGILQGSGAKLPEGGAFRLGGIHHLRRYVCTASSLSYCVIQYLFVSLKPTIVVSFSWALAPRTSAH